MRLVWKVFTSALLAAFITLFLWGFNHTIPIHPVFIFLPAFVLMMFRSKGPGGGESGSSGDDAGNWGGDGGDGGGDGGGGD
ncbi:MAG: hypothetical protein CME88_10540 [Hirschia sp.]|nr:hypothetical protein [Hirschia sp.]MBF18804.1 hypothetical protein [Hirschia sp.]